MENTNKCNCPLCGKDFIPASGITPEEHIAGGILRVYRKMQKSKPMEELPCPRCGEMKMRAEVAENALSRHFDIIVCSDCGTDEALRDYAKDVLPLTDWSAVDDLLASLPKIE